MGVDGFSIAIVAAFMVCAGTVGWFYYQSDNARSLFLSRKNHHLLDNDEAGGAGEAGVIELTATTSERYRDGDDDGETKEYLEDMRMNVLGTMM